MNELEIDRRIFVVGVPRSGTTLVQSLLAAHSRVTSFTESHFWSRHFVALPRLSAAILTRDPAPRVRQFLVENGFDPDDAGAAGRATAGRWLLPFHTRAVARRLLSVLDRLALSRGRSTWVEKTPRHLRYVPFLERLAGGARFVHVIRDGLEVVASLHTASRSWERPYDLDTCIERWNADVGFSLGRVAPQGRPRDVAAAPNDHFVFYEELTSRPEATLERLLGGLGLDWEPEILARYAAGSRRLITGEETWKAGVAGGVRPSATSGRVLTAGERERVRGALCHDLYARLRERTAP